MSADLEHVGDWRKSYDTYHGKYVPNCHNFIDTPRAGNQDNLRQFVTLRTMSSALLALLTGALAAACSNQTAASASPPRELRMSALAVADPLIKAAYSPVQNVTIRVTSPGGASITNLNDLQQDVTDIGIALADTTYLAYNGQLDEGGKRYDQLRGLAVLNVNTFHFLAGPRTGIRSVAQLRAKRVAIGPGDTSTAIIGQTLLELNGVSLRDVIAERLPYPETVQRLLAGHVDAAFMIQIVGTQTVGDAVRGGARLLNLEGPLIEDLRQQRPFLRRTLIPKGTYPGQDNPVHTLAVDRVMLCRADLDENLVYELLEAYFADSPGTVPPTNFERAPATPLPLHPGALRYYRQRELSR